MRKHKVTWGPGYRFFECEDCGHQWKERSRDCTSPSLSDCPECHEICYPNGNEKHYEWETDGSGNLLDTRIDNHL